MNTGSTNGQDSGQTGGPQSGPKTVQKIDSRDRDPVRTPMGEAWFMYRRNKAAMVGLVFLILIVLATILGPILNKTDPFRVVARPRQSPSESPLLLGSDYLGRDTWVGILNGGRVTLLLALSAGLMTVIIGILIGATAGYFGGKVEFVLMRFTEIFQVPPAILLGMLVLLLWGSSVRNVVLAISLVAWPQTARLARGEFIRLRNVEYVKSARAAGASDWRIMSRIILPNALPPLIVNATLIIGGSILFESGLAFLGLTDPNVITWGLMLGSSRPYVFDTWWAVTFPGLAIFLTVLSISLVGDGINDAFNPKLRER